MTTYVITTSNTPVRPRDKQERKPAITTNQVVPIQPERPAVLKPAKGPMITTENVGAKHPAPAITVDAKPVLAPVHVPVPFHKKPGRKPKR